MIRSSHIFRAKALIAGVLLAGLILLPGVAKAADRPAYLLGAGDKVRVTVFDEPDLSGDLTVSDQGDISLPLIGSLAVAGKTLGEVQVAITQKYGEKYLVNPRVNVDVLNYRPFFILGEVKNPGSYPYVAGMTIVNAVALAGGYTPRGNKRRTTITRANSNSTTEEAANEYGAVLPGDVIRVPERLF